MTLPPRVAYNGITIIMSNPSRFDRYKLLSGYAETLLNSCFAPKNNLYGCDVMTMEHYKGASSLRPGTKVVLMLGEGTLKLIPNNKRSINQQRGSPLTLDGLPAIASYFPQDCIDFQNWEAKYNIQANSTGTLEKGEDDKNHGATSKENWKFWLWKDVQKLVRIRDNPSLINANNYNIQCYPSVDVVLGRLSGPKKKSFYLDIETDIGLNITCLSFAFEASEITVVPFIRYNYTKCYSDIDTAKILRAIAVAMRDNEVVIHNAMFDLLVLAWKYRIPPGKRIFDTMLGQHRCFPEQEKSLGHAISLWTYLPYHKDEGCFMPNNSSQETALWMYNAKDVYSMILVREAIDSYAKTISGLSESIAQGNASIRPYLLTTLLGIAYDESKRAKICSNNDRAMMQCLRAMKLLMGYGLANEIGASSKSGFIMSNPQCVNYFHYKMCYPVLKKSDKTGEPSLDEKVLQRLKLKYMDNRVIDFLLSYRANKKQTGSLQFLPWCEQPIFK